MGASVGFYDWMGLCSSRHVLLRLSRALIIALGALGFAVASAAAKDLDKSKSVWDQETLTGDWGGARSTLKDKYGVEIALNYVDEVFDVLSGGLQRRASYEGRLEFSVDADLQKLIGWSGATAHVTVYNIHNGGHTVAENVGSIADPSNIDALPTTRLFTAWIQQNFYDDRISVRLGQLGADDEFIVSPTSGALLNGTFGWAGILAANMTNGGPVYPLATPGVRLQVKPTKELAVLAAVFSGDPAGRNCNDDPQQCNKYGTTFSFSGGALWMGELQYAINQDKQAAGLPGVYKLGGWYASADFADQHFGLDGAGGVVSLVDPATTDSLNHRSNWGVYAVADQRVWQSGERSLNLFMRSSVSPSDRNLISFYIDAGAGVKGLLPGRSEDVLSFGVAYAKISSDAAAFDRDTLAVNGPPCPIRNAEVVLELSYAVQIAPWWTIQPDLQYIIHTGGEPGSDAKIAGVRSILKF